MEDLNGLIEFVKTEKGIEKLTMEELMAFVPEFEMWKIRN